MFGSKGRIGAIIPANNSTIEPEVWPRLPADTAFYATRILARGNLTAAAVKAMEANVDRAADELAATGVDIVAYADMVTTFIMDADWSRRRSAELAKTAKAPVVTCWTALQAALSSLGTKSFVLGTPYPAPIHALCRPFFEAQGYRIASDATLNILAMTDVPKVTTAEVVDFASSIDLSDAQAIVLLATDLPTFGAVEAIEQKTGLPVLTSNQTLLWHALRLCSNTAAIPGLGKLFHA